MKQISTQQRGFFFQQSTIVIRLFRHQPHPLPKKKKKNAFEFSSDSVLLDDCTTQETMKTIMISKNLGGEQSKIWAM